MATLKEIADRVIRNTNRADLFSETPDNTQYSYEVVYDEINDIMKEVTTESNFRILEATQTIALQADTTEYALPADFQRSESMFFADANGTISRIVNYVDKHMFETLTANEDSLFFNPLYIGNDSKPLVFTIEGANVRIKPMTVQAGTTMVHKYYKFIDELTDGNDTNYFTLNYPKLLALGATYSILDTLIQPRGDNAIIGAALRRYEAEKGRVIISESISKGTETIAVSNRV